MKLSEWAKSVGLNYKTAWKLFKENNLPVKAIQLKTGTIIVEEEKISNAERNTVIYCRVSNHSRKKEIEYQVERCKNFCYTNGWTINKIHKEIASGMNDNRKILWQMIESNPSRIVIENKDRLTRFGFNYIEKFLIKNGCEIVVINKTEEDEKDLLKDLTSVIYSFCARLYGMRRAKNKTDKCKEIILND
jgi:putative resolvase